VLDPDVVLRADPIAVQAAAANAARGAPRLSAEMRGAAAVATTFVGRAQAVQPALVNGAVGLVLAPAGRTRVAFDFTIAGGKIVGIDIIADPKRLRWLDLTVL